MNNLESEYRQILNKKKFEEDIMINTKSNIFKSLDEIDFITKRLKSDEKLKDKKISFNLLFKATRDGQNAYDFHRKCDGKVQQLVFIKTTKGEIFGGYTEVGYRSRDSSAKDNNSFFFFFFK